MKVPSTLFIVLLFSRVTSFIGYDQEETLSMTDAVLQGVGAKEVCGVTDEEIGLELLNNYDPADHKGLLTEKMTKICSTDKYDVYSDLMITDHSIRVSVSIKNNDEEQIEVYHETLTIENLISKKHPNLVFGKISTLNGPDHMTPLNIFSLAIYSDLLGTNRAFSTTDQFITHEEHELFPPETKVFEYSVVDQESQETRIFLFSEPKLNNRYFAMLTSEEVETLKQLHLRLDFIQQLETLPEEWQKVSWASNDAIEATENSLTFNKKDGDRNLWINFEWENNSKDMTHTAKVTIKTDIEDLNSPDAEIMEHMVKEVTPQKSLKEVKCTAAEWTCECSFSLQKRIL